MKTGLHKGVVAALALLLVLPVAGAFFMIEGSPSGLHPCPMSPAQMAAMCRTGNHRCTAACCRCQLSPAPHLLAVSLPILLPPPSGFRLRRPLLLSAAVAAPGRLALLAGYLPRLDRPPSSSSLPLIAVLAY